MSYWTEEELKAMTVVKFRTTDSRGVLVNFQTPNCADVLSPDGTPLVWNTHQGLGLSGAVSRFGGIGLAKGSIVLTMGTPQHRVEFDLGCKRYLSAPPQGQPAKIYDVEHPRLARIGVTRIKLMNDPGGSLDKQTQIETVTYQWEAHRKPLPTLSSPTTSGQSKDGAKASSGTRAAMDAAIAQNSADIKRLTAERDALP